MKIAQYVETFGYVGMFNTMNFASYICLYLISPFMQHPVYSPSCALHCNWNIYPYFTFKLFSGR